MYIYLKNTGIALSVITLMVICYALKAHQAQPHQHQAIANTVKSKHLDDPAGDHNVNATNNLATSHKEHAQNVRLSPHSMALANIKVASIEAQFQSFQEYAPGEIKANGYKSYVASPRTESVIISRHAALGEHVKTGQKLVTLFSESVSQAQADYLIAATQWHRVKKLGNKTVSERQLLEAQTHYNASYGKLIALGFTEKAINAISTQDIKAFGQYTLTAKREGVVLQDDFIQGQRVNAGDTVMLLADEKQLWIEAKLSPNKQLDLPINSAATIALNGQSHQAHVIQETHTIDPKTRTRIIRLAIDNADDTLHAGMFVKVYFQLPTKRKVMAVPETALSHNKDGEWQVFVEQHPGQFQAKTVQRGQSLGHLQEIIGLENGARIVTEGAFFVASEIAKSGFDPHNH